MKVLRRTRRNIIIGASVTAVAGLVVGGGVWWNAQANAQTTMAQEWSRAAETVAEQATELASYTNGLVTILEDVDVMETKPDAVIIQRAKTTVSDATDLLSALTEDNGSNLALFALTGELGPGDPSAVIEAIMTRSSVGDSSTASQSGDTGPQSDDSIPPAADVMAAELGYIENDAVAEAQSGSQSGDQQSSTGVESIRITVSDPLSETPRQERDVEYLVSVREDLSAQNDAVLEATAALVNSAYQTEYQSTVMELEKQQKDLADALTKAEKTLKDSEGHVADPATRDALTKAISNAKKTASKEMPVRISEVKEATKHTKNSKNALTKATQAVADSITAQQRASEVETPTESNDAESYENDYGTGDYSYDNSWSGESWADNEYSSPSSTNGGGYTPPVGGGGYTEPSSPTPPHNGGGNSGGSTGGSGSGGNNVDWGEWCMEGDLGEDPVQVPCS